MLFDIKKIQYEGAGSKNPFAFKQYNAEEVVGNKTMEEHLRFSMAYWHTLTGEGADPFGAGTMERPWNKYSDEMDKARVRVEANFELLEKLNIPFFCFHDADIAPQGNSLKEFQSNLDIISDMMVEKMKETGKKLLWGTANNFSHPRYVHGAATSCNADVYAMAAAQVKKAMEVTQKLGGENYVFWGGREGYETILNTNMKLEQDNLAKFMHMAVGYAKEIGFDGQFLIEPKPMEPTKHQYDFDTATVIGFLKTYGLDQYFKMNIETNHATLAGHTLEHELHLARINGILGSVDANQGDLLLGWDTDQFPTDLYTTTLAMYEILKNGGLHKGGLNFDAKTRRGSFDIKDLFHGHIVGMDAFARGLKAAHKMLEDQVFEERVKDRYASFDSGIGKIIVDGKANFKILSDHALGIKEIKNVSGRQELLEGILNSYL